MSELPLKIELELFEQVRAAPETDLLRVALRVSGGSGLVGRPTLLLELGDRAQRRQPILAPPDIEGVLRAAYAVAASRLTEQTKFALEFEGGAVVDLPAPIPGQARAGREEVAAQADGGRPRDSARTKAELRNELDVAREQAAIAQSREIEFAALAIEAGTAAAELQAECERLSALNAELDVPPPDDSLLVEAAQIARRQAEERAADAISVAETARQRTVELEARATELEGAAAEAAERVTGLEWAVAEAERINGSLEHDLASAREVLTQRDQALAHARDELRIMTVERDELTRQVAAYDGVAMKARERAKHADEASAASAAALNELQSWRTDLERRLAETTAELASSRSARHTAETEVRSLRGLLAEAEAKVELAEGRSGSLDAELRDARAEERDAKLELIRKSAEQRTSEEAERELRDAADARRSGLS